MSCIDYGAILKINNEFVNKDCDLFMDMKDSVGFVLETAHDEKYGDIKIDGNYYVYAGDKELLMCFYKGSCVVINNKNIVGVYRTEFKSETFFLNDVKLTISRLDNDYIVDKYGFKYRSFRFVATWEYKGNSYECIYGYGIDPNSQIWEEVKGDYGFSEKEISIIDKWFKE